MEFLGCGSDKIAAVIKDHGILYDLVAHLQEFPHGPAAAPQVRQTVFPVVEGVQHPLDAGQDSRQTRLSDRNLDGEEHQLDRAVERGLAAAHDDRRAGARPLGPEKGLRLSALQDIQSGGVQGGLSQIAGHVPEQPVLRQPLTPQYEFPFQMLLDDVQIQFHNPSVSAAVRRRSLVQTIAFYKIAPWIFGRCDDANLIDSCYFI